MSPIKIDNVIRLAAKTASGSRLTKPGVKIFEDRR